MKPVALPLENVNYSLILTSFKAAPEIDGYYLLLFDATKCNLPTWSRSRRAQSVSVWLGRCFLPAYTAAILSQFWLNNMGSRNGTFPFKSVLRLH